MEYFPDRYEVEAIGNAIGKFFGGIINGIADAATAGLPELGRRFSEFMTNLQPFLYGIKSVTPETAQAAKDLASALLVLTAGNLVDQLTNWLFGDQDLGKFGEDLAAFGKGVKKFNDEVTDIKPETIKAGAEAGKLLAEMASEMPREDGWWQRIIGKKDLESFGGTLQKFGEGVRLFGEETANVDPDTIKAGAEAGTQLAEMASELSRSGGVWQEFWGEKDLGLFSTNMTSLGRGIKSFAINIADVGAETVVSTTDSAVKMFNAIKKFDITNKSPIMKIKVKTFKSQLKGIAEGIKAFVSDMSNVGTVDVESMTSVIDSATQIVDAFNEIGFKQKSSNTLADFIANIITAAINYVNKSKPKMFNASKDLIANFINGFKKSTPSVKNAVSDICGTATKEISNSANYSNFYNSGLFIGQGLANGISDSSSWVKRAATSVANTAKNVINAALGIESPSKELYKSGEYTIEGYTNALDDGQGDISKAGSAMGNRLLSVFNDYILRIQQMIEDGIEINPVIRPTLDLSYVEGDMARLNGMFSDSGYMARINSTSAQMSKNQNGSSNEDIVDAIGELGDRIENAQGDRINVGNININDSDEDVAEAIEILIRKALLERRR